MSPSRATRDGFVLLALWLMVFAVSSQFLIVAPLLPRIAEQLSVATDRLSLLITGYAVAVSGVALLMGPVSDRLGRRRMLLLGTAAMSAALALHGMAADFPTLLLVRVLAGAGGGILTGAAAAYVGDYFPYCRRGWANGWVMSGMAAGQILGIPLGALLAARFGFRAPFVGFAGAMALACVMVWAWVPQPALRCSADPVSLRGVLRHYRALLARPEVAAAAATYFSLFLATALYTVYLPVWLETARGAAAGQVAAVFAAGGVATMLAGPRAGRLSDRIGRRRVVIAATLGAAFLMLITPWVVVAVQAAYPLFFALMALVAARSGSLDALLSQVVPDSLRGSLMSLMMAVGQLGFGLGGAVAGAAYAALGYASNTGSAALAALLAAAAVWRFLPEPPLQVSRAGAETRRPPGTYGHLQPTAEPFEE